MRISEKALNMKYSAVRKLVPLASEAESKGVKVYRLNIGQPNIETPELFFEGLRNIPDNCNTRWKWSFNNGNASYL